MHAQRDVGVFGRVFRGFLDADLVEGDLLGALAGDILEMNGAHAQQVRSHRIHVVARRRAVEHIRLEHGVVALALQPYAVVLQHMDVELQVLADLAVVRILEHRAQRLEHTGAIELLRRTGVVVPQRHVGCVTGFDAERDTDDLGAHVVKTRGFGIECKQVSRAQCVDPARQRVPVHHGVVVPRQAGQGRRHRVGRYRQLTGGGVGVSRGRPRARRARCRSGHRAIGRAW
jgi:hypothetical protein